MDNDVFLCCAQRDVGLPPPTSGLQHWGDVKVSLRLDIVPFDDVQVAGWLAVNEHQGTQTVGGATLSALYPSP